MTNVGFGLLAGLTAALCAVWWWERRRPASDRHWSEQGGLIFDNAPLASEID